jgi:hypothetical protein
MIGKKERDAITPDTAVSVILDGASGRGLIAWDLIGRSSKKNMSALTIQRAAVT